MPTNAHSKQSKKYPCEDTMVEQVPNTYVNDSSWPRPDGIVPDSALWSTASRLFVPNEQVAHDHNGTQTSDPWVSTNRTLRKAQGRTRVMPRASATAVECQPASCCQDPMRCKARSATPGYNALPSHNKSLQQSHTFSHASPDNAQCTSTMIIITIEYDTAMPFTSFK